MENALPKPKTEDVQAVNHGVLCNHAFACRRAHQCLPEETPMERDKDLGILVAVLWNLARHIGPPSCFTIHSLCGSASCSFETVLFDTCELVPTLSRCTCCPSGTGSALTTSTFFS